MKPIRFEIMLAVGNRPVGYFYRTLKIGRVFLRFRGYKNQFVIDKGLDLKRFKVYFQRRNFGFSFAVQRRDLTPNRPLIEYFQF